jgi:antagonist of KipI
MLEIISPGLQSSVQDLGRKGLRHLGVVVSGAADRDALAIGNRLIGNPPDAAGIEATLSGPTLRFRLSRLVAITGGECEASCDGRPLPTWRMLAVAAGSEIRIGRVTRGARVYIAVGGGIAVPPILGSRSTDMRANFGGWHGRALKIGDRLPFGREEPAVGQRLLAQLDGTRGRVVAAPWWVTPTEDLRGDTALLHLEFGPDAVMLDPRALRILRDGTWTMAADSDRMGLRFDGPTLRVASKRELISTAVMPGTVQLPPDGHPVLLGVDAQTVGGYPRIAQVIRADMGRAMQLRPGERVRPVLVTPDAADAASRTRSRELARLAEAIRYRLAST